MPQAAVLRLVLAGSSIGLLLTFTAPFVLGIETSVGWWLMQCVPLALTLPGVLQLHGRTLQWLGFLVLFYFTEGVLQSFSADLVQRWLGALTLLFCLAVFTAVIVAVRRNKQPHQPRE